MTTLTLAGIARRRLRAQGIADPADAAPAAVVARLGAVQAQDYPASRWAVGLRCAPGADGSGAVTDADVLRAVEEERAVVRTWPMRGTLHLVPAADVRWMLPLLTPRVVAGSAARAAQLGLDDATLARAFDLVATALEGGRERTRAELLEAMERGGVPMDASRGYHVLSRAAMAGLVCFGPMAGKQPTFALLDEWAPPRRGDARDRDDALREIARRYFTGHGPATQRDLCWWTGLTAADAKRGTEAAGADLARATGEDGRAYWMAADAADDPDDPDPTDAVHLLPAFDEFYVAYRDRDAVIDPEHAAKVVPGGNGVFRPLVVPGAGRVVGTWKREVKRGAVTVALESFDPDRAPFTPGERAAFDAAAARYAAFVRGG